MTDRDVDTLELPDIWFASLAHPTEARLEMIRQHYLTEINGMIREAQRFRETDFSVLLKNESNISVLEIAYRYEPEYRFAATMRTDDDVAVDVYFSITASPGNIFKKERWDGIRSTQLTDHIRAWLGRLANELASIPIQRQIEEQQKEIERILGELDGVSKESFSKEEGERLRAKLDELEAQLKTNLEETITNQTELSVKVAGITNDMSALKENIGVLNKQGWLKSYVTRTLEWAKDPANRKLLKTGAEAAKEFLLEAGDRPPGT